MQINVTFRHVEPSEPLKLYAEEKISRIKKYLEEPIEAHVVLKVEKFRQIAEVQIEANGLRINGTEQTDNMYSAIDLLADTLEAQVNKARGKGRRRKSSESVKDYPVRTEAPAEDDDEPERRVIRTEQIHAKPMDIEEAVMQLNLSGGEFLVFLNRHSNRINVLYNRKDGHLGLVETIA